MTFARLATFGTLAALLSCSAALTGCSSASDGATSAGEGSAVTATPKTVTLTDADGPSALNTKFDALYSNPANFDKIADLAYAEVGYDTPPCATFMSFALETLVGVSFPAKHSQELVPEFNVSLPVNGVQAHTTVAGGTQPYEIRYNTTGLATYLVETHGWNVVWSPDDLIPGDVVFILPADFPQDPTGLHSAHTYMFHQWIDQTAGFAWVIDNEADGYCAPDEDPKDRTFIAYCDADGGGPTLCCAGAGKHMYKRSVKTVGTEPDGETDPQMWYALRAPADADAGAPVAPVAADAGSDAGTETDTDADTNDDADGGSDTDGGATN